MTISGSGIGYDGNWEVKQSQIARDWQGDQTEEDLVAILVHELGHWLGMIDNTSNQGHFDGGTMARHIGRNHVTGRVIYDADVEAIRSLYGSRGRQRYWFEWDGSVAGQGYAFGGTSNFLRTDGDIGRKSSGAYRVISTALNRAGTRQYFTSADYPLTSSSSWNQEYIETSSWHTAGIASNGLSGENGLWVAAWFTKPTRGGLLEDQRLENTLEIVLSNDRFQPGSIIRSWSEPYSSAFKPSVTYDAASGYFYIVFANHQHPYDFGEMGYLRISNPVNELKSWSGLVSLNLHTLDSPDMECGLSSVCVLSYTRASAQDVTNVVRKYTVGSYGVLGSPSSPTQTISTGYQYTAPIDFYYKSPSYRWVLAYQNTTLYDLRANGEGYLTYHESTTAPPPQNVLVSAGFTVPVPFPTAIATHRYLSTGYALVAF